MNKRSLFEWVGVLLVAIVVILFLNPISPINYQFGYDQNVFAYMGAFWVNGHTPYADFFDHKGALLYLIYALGYIIAPGKLGISVVSIINLAIVQKLILAISRTVLKGASNYIHYAAVAVAMSFFVLLCEGAFTVEEYSLCFTLLPLLLYVRFMESGKALVQHPLVNSFVYGACFGAIALIRVNNATIIVGIVLGFLIWMIKSKEYRALLNNALWVFLGFAAAVLPFVLYFWCKDALYEMIHATFLFNLKYKAVWTEVAHSADERGLNWLQTLPCLLLVALTLLYDRRFNKCYSYCLIPASVVCYLAFLSGASYWHYFVNVMPYILLSFIFIVALSKTTRQRLVFGALLLLSLISYRNAPFRLIYLLRSRVVVAISDGDKVRRAEYDSLSELVSQIPVEQRGSVYCYDAVSVYPNLIEQDIYPIFRIAFQANEFGIVDPAIKEEIDNFHDTTTAKWIIKGVSNLAEMPSFERLLAKYELVAESSHNIQLYRLKP